MGAHCMACEAALGEAERDCPRCGAPRGAGGLIALASEDSLDRALADGLARSLTGSLLADLDTAGALARDLDIAGPLAPSELMAAARRLEADSPTLAELSTLLPADQGKLSLDGVELSRLLDGRIEGLPMLKSGIVLLRHRRYAEAAEWWSLHRDRLDPTQGRLDLVLLMMEIFTLMLAGDRARAAALRAQLRQHPMYTQYRGTKRA